MNPGEWQDLLKQQQRIWTVFVEGGTTFNFYDSEEGAKLEVIFRENIGQKCHVDYFYLHTNHLSWIRWVQNFSNKGITE